MCIELNACSKFFPWLLGSQCCEKIFRAARSLSSTFSTVIDFRVLGLVRRLHHLQVLLLLESEYKDINYPITGSHKEKEASVSNPHSVTLEEISINIQNAHEMAKKSIENLGITNLLQEKEHWDNPPIPGLATITISREDDDIDDDQEQWIIVD